MKSIWVSMSDPHLCTPRHEPAGGWLYLTLPLSSWYGFAKYSLSITQKAPAYKAKKRWIGYQPKDNHGDTSMGARGRILAYTLTPYLWLSLAGR